MFSMSDLIDLKTDEETWITKKREAVLISSGGLMMMLRRRLRVIRLRSGLGKGLGDQFLGTVRQTKCPLFGVWKGKRILFR